MSCMADNFAGWRDSDKNIIYTDFDGYIIDCNNSWLETCGFRRDEVINKKNSILQGILTERDTVDEINREVKKRNPVDVIVTNFKKSGVPFKNRLQITPVNDGFFAEIQDMGPSDYELEYNRSILRRR